jgi:hypothetical protein
MYGDVGNCKKRNEELEMAFDPNWVYGNIGLSWGIHHLHDISMSQIVVVTIFVSGAMLYLGREFYLRFLKKESTCEGCAVSKINRPSL